MIVLRPAVILKIVGGSLAGDGAAKMVRCLVRGWIAFGYARMSLVVLSFCRYLYYD
jgi:hypothetical protein